MAKKSHKFARSSSSRQPRRRLLVRRREERRRHTSLWLTKKDELPLAVLCRVGSRRRHLQAVVLRLQAHVSSLFSLSLQSPSRISPSRSLSAFSPDGERAERDRERAEREIGRGKRDRRERESKVVKWHGERHKIIQKMLVTVVRNLRDQRSSMDYVGVLPLEKLKFLSVVLILTCIHLSRNQPLNYLFPFYP